MLTSRSFSRLGMRRGLTQTEVVSRVTETFSISLPPGMAVQLERVRKEEHRTRSELIREALRTYFKNKAYRDSQ
jgi:Ribbon-helix-helix protein, copG family